MTDEKRKFQENVFALCFVGMFILIVIAAVVEAL
jgi:hypothetical protein